MAIDLEHAWAYSRVLPCLQESMRPLARVLISGVQDIVAQTVYPFNTVAELFRSWHWFPYEVDLHDPRAMYAFDWNELLPSSLWDSFDLIFDIGTLEHVADTITALKSYLLCCRSDGFIFILTPIRGYYDHGFHTFSPEFLPRFLTLNNCEEILTLYADKNGAELSAIEITKVPDVLGIYLYRKNGEIETFVLPQQARWIKPCH